MRTTVILLLISLLGFSASYAQDKPCDDAVKPYLLQRNFDAIYAAQSAARKLELAKGFIQNECITADQLRQMAKTMASDKERVELGKAAYSRILDPENFFDLYDAFSYFSNALRLYHATQAGQPTAVPAVVTTPAPAEPKDRKFSPDKVVYADKLKAAEVKTAATPMQNLNDFPPLHYPEIFGYAGNKDCPGPLSEAVFTSLAGHIRSLPPQQSKYQTAVQLAKTNCLSVAQLMKFATLMPDDTTRLEFAKVMHGYSYDADHYSSMTLTMESNALRTELLSYIAGQPGKSPAELPVQEVEECVVSEAKMKEIIASVDKQDFDEDRSKMAKQLIEAFECFTASQIKDILDIITFESAKLEISKFAYDYCIDPKNYFLVYDSFSFSSSIDELGKYIEGKE